MSDCMDARTRDRLKAFCKVGRLFDAERLLEEVGTAQLRKTRKWTPLFTAVDRGFHSLVELLLRYDHAQWDLDKAYEGAHRRRRSDLAALILSASSWSATIDPVEVLATGDVGVARKLHDAGTDFTTGDIILKGAMRNAGGTLNIVTELGLRSSEVDEQLYSAMVSHMDQKHVASVIRFLRSGFDPHKAARYLDDRGRLSEEKESTVYVSMFSGKPGFFAALKPSPLKDDAVELIRTAVFLGSAKMLKILLDAGFPLNCKVNGGSPALDEVIGGRTLKNHFQSPGYGQRNEPPRYTNVAADAYMRAVESFVKQGAQWVPDQERNELRMLRDTLLALGEIYVVRLFKMLDEHEAAKREHLKTLFAADRMKPLARVVRQSLPWV
jgi:hypothetical protein